MDAELPREFHNRRHTRSTWVYRSKGLWCLLGGICLGQSSWAETNSFPEFKSGAAQTYLSTIVQTIQEQAGSGADVCFMLARLQHHRGRDDEAEKMAQEAQAKAPQYAEIPSFLADLYIRQGRLEDALRCLRITLELDPKFMGAHRRLGMVLDRLGDREGARKEFQEAIDQAPEDATARLLLGRLLLDNGQAKEAVTHLAKACQLDPGLANAFYVLGQAHMRMGNHEAAENDLKMFQQLKQKEMETLGAENANYNDEQVMRALATSFHAEAADVLLQQQQVTLAEAHLRQAVKIAPQETLAYEKLAALYLQSGRLMEAREMGSELVRLRPKVAAYRVNFGTLLLQLREFPAAVENLKSALELDSNQPQALNNLTRFYLGARRELPEALALARRLVVVQPTAANYDLLGWALNANGRTAEARNASAQAVEKEPNNAVYREHLRRLQQLP